MPVTHAGEGGLLPVCPCDRMREGGCKRSHTAGKGDCSEPNQSQSAISDLCDVPVVVRLRMAGLGPGKVKQAQENSQTLRPTRS